MKKSENVSKTPIPLSQKSESSGMQGLLPFSGLGFDLRPVLTRRISVRLIGREATRPAELPLVDFVLPSGRRLQLRLGQEIRGR
ncbi:hypothetical protein [Desulfomicrobium apsheronum]|nr:hypothetical protein [Desulfomicrobium apsheronum]